ncbi:MAG TPA: Mur ligase family protein [Pyrinomonadaceae bacterium]|nr:Mur ligase family protein [Pyrinomonadaceae bacterium]
MNFHESVKYLYSLGNEVLAMKLGLASTEKLLARLGNPQNNFLKIQIAGTNGKGSTCAFLEAICLAAGIRAGLTTSPHLVSITERIKIGGAEISEKDFARHATRVREISESLAETGELETVPTFFEQVTAIAVAAFAEAKIELAILETGLGGRFDSVTATRAEIAAITPVDYDHQKILGGTLAEIAAEKAAIIRENTRKVIVAPQKKEAARVISGRCREMQIEPVEVFPEVIPATKPAVEDYSQNAVFNTGKVTFISRNDRYPGIGLNLWGKHQWTNAATAIEIAETLRELGFRVGRADIISGLENARHKGRLEFYKNILFDGAHNAAGAKALAEYFDEFIRQPITLIFGAMRDKDLSEIAKILFPRAEFLIFTRAENPRSMETGEFMKFLPESFERENVYQAQTAEEALKIASFVSGKGIICVTGSLYLVGEAQKILSARDK